jgi:hypothetical protein
MKAVKEPRLKSSNLKKRSITLKARFFRGGEFFSEKVKLSPRERKSTFLEIVGRLPNEPDPPAEKHFFSDAAPTFLCLFVCVIFLAGNEQGFEMNIDFALDRLVWSPELPRVCTRVARLFLVQKYQKRKNIPNVHKLYQKAVNYIKWP